MNSNFLLISFYLYIYYSYIFSDLDNKNVINDFIELLSNRFLNVSMKTLYKWHGNNMPD